MLSRFSHRPAPARRAARGFVALAAVASLTLAGCSSDDSATPAGSDAPEGQETAEGVDLMGQWPLTGLPGDTEAPKHPVMVVKIDNSSNSSPQIGLSKADLVTEELVEGGTTRLAVFYYSQTPRVVGPVRSMRATDIGIVQPAQAALIASGGAPPTVRRVADAGIDTFTEGARGYVRATDRSAPYNLMMKLPVLARSLKAPEPPSGYLPWGNEDDFPKGQKAKGVAAQFSGSHTTNWRYAGGTYDNLNSYAAQGDHFAPNTLLVLRVEVGDAGYRDPAGNPVPETKFTGTGDAMVFHKGRMVRATWEKPGLDAKLTLKTKAGELQLPPGKVWMELVPKNGGNVSVTR
ncbi:DUF3048 domain-containing protein [Nocardioides iriomotensis]|uniref:DUF3048 domain-containing protein n=1 Tax=Nocardioides iriomotensis TaxID=715784 RepID=A0A4Q5J5Y3_9ACTN|nr:DUF3048 domain-containing protein [Nocardioides iriomotensis]RYU12945.1 DUF3048 domain-containing protein [Nocardioides iriomotensis]